jgi:hypothetical protein
MKSSALILILGIIAIAALSCTQPTPPVTAVTAQKAIACTTTDLMTKVKFLQTPFDPRRNSSPQPSNVPVPANIQNDLQNAFNIAPSILTARLCDLTYIFIDPTGCADPTRCTLPPNQLSYNSWGLRGYHGGDTTGEYIATSAALWPNGGSAPSISSYENGRLQFLLQHVNPNAANWSPGPQITSAAPDTPQMAVLAALAHETGHVYWYDAFVKNRGGHADLNRFCSGNFYTPGSWSHNIDAPPGRWIEFGDRSDNQSYNPDYVSMLASALRMSNFPQAATILYQIYQNQDLADALAAFSPDEDFVEAYQWAVLLKANPPLSSLAIQIPGSPAYDIAAGNLANQGGLRRKMNCF